MGRLGYFPTKLRVRVTYLNKLIHFCVCRLIFYFKDMGLRDRRLGLRLRYLLSHRDYLSFSPRRCLNPFDLGFFALRFLRSFSVLSFAFGLLGCGRD
jgi:hypothetical protein